MTAIYQALNFTSALSFHEKKNEQKTSNTENPDIDFLPL